MATSNTANNQVNAEVNVKQAIANIDKKKKSVADMASLTESKKGGGSTGNSTNIFHREYANDIEWPPIPLCFYWAYEQRCLDKGLTSGAAGSGITDDELMEMTVVSTKPQLNSKGKETGKTVYTYKNLNTEKTYTSVQKPSKHLTASGYAKRFSKVLTRS